jgi:hypothetical protein
MMTTRIRARMPGLKEWWLERITALFQSDALNF